MKISSAMALALVFALAACSSDEESTAGHSGEQSATMTAAAAPVANYAFPGFAVFEKDGRLWVFRADSKGHQDYLKSGPPGESVTMVGAGPGRMTLKSDHREVLVAYTATKPGFRVFEEEDRLWVFREGSEALAEYQTRGAPAERVTRVGAGPRRETLRSADAETLEAYIAAWR